MRSVDVPAGVRLPFLDKGINQVAMVVEDLDKTVENYYKVFGIGPWHFYTYERPLVKHMTYHGKDVDYSMRVALSYVGPMRVELIEMKRGDTVYADFVRDHGYGVHHFGLDGDGHYAYLDTEDTLGTTYELICRPERRMKPERVYPPEE